MNVISRLKDIRKLSPIWWAICAVVVFHAASRWPAVASLMVVFFYCLIKASQEGCGRRNFYLGLAIGMGIYSWHLRFFTNIFSGAALILWLVLALWVGLFMMLASHYQRRRSVPLQCVMLTCAWVALEYFRGELCFLKFTWATPSLAFKGLHGTSLLGALGVYGVSGLCVSLAAVALLFPHKYQILWILLATVGLDLVRHLIERNRKTTT